MDNMDTNTVLQNIYSTNSRWAKNIDYVNNDITFYDEWNELMNILNKLRNVIRPRLFIRCKCIIENYNTMYPERKIIYDREQSIDFYKLYEENLFGKLYWDVAIICSTHTNDIFGHDDYFNFIRALTSNMTSTQINPFYNDLIIFLNELSDRDQLLPLFNKGEGNHHIDIYIIWYKEMIKNILNRLNDIKNEWVRDGEEENEEENEIDNITELMENVSVATQTDIIVKNFDFSTNHQSTRSSTNSFIDVEKNAINLTKLQDVQTKELENLRQENKKLKNMIMKNFSMENDRFIVYPELFNIFEAVTVASITAEKYNKEKWRI